jgi:hypothetical protein
MSGLKVPEFQRKNFSVSRFQGFNVPRFQSVVVVQLGFRSSAFLAASSRAKPSFRQDKRACPERAQRVEGDLASIATNP